MMIDYQDEKRQNAVAAELAGLIRRVFADSANSTTVTDSFEMLLVAAVAAFFPHLRQFPGQALQLSVDGEITEVVIPLPGQEAMKLRSDEITLALTTDERSAVRFLAEAIARNPYKFQGIRFRQDAYDQ